jgi:hypothetical protein
MGLWLFKFDQPRGFKAMRLETVDFHEDREPRSCQRGAR